MKKYFSLFIIGGMLFSIACQETATDKTTETKTSDSTANGPASDLSKARAWIENDNAKFVEEAKKGDSNALAAHYASDAWLMFDNSEPLKGKDIASGWGGAIRMGMKEIKVTTVDVVGNADLLA